MQDIQFSSWIQENINHIQRPIEKLNKGKTQRRELTDISVIG